MSATTNYNIPLFNQSTDGTKTFLAHLNDVYGTATSSFAQIVDATLFSLSQNKLQTSVVNQKITTSTTAPTLPNTNDIWIDLN